MQSCAFLTLADPTGYHIDDHLAADALRAVGYAVETIPWDAPGQVWDRFDAVVVRSTWDYHKQVDAFFDVLDHIASSGPRLFNPLGVMRWNADKRYLAERTDMPFPKTSLISRDTDLGPILATLPEEVVVKPLIGCGGKGVTRLPRDAEAIREILEPGREYLLQPFLPEILEGEKSLYFYAKRYRYAAIKRPKPGEFRGNEEYADSDGYDPTAEEIAFAEDVVRRFGSQSMIERIDICGRHVIEMSIECPGLKLKKLGLEKEAGPWTLEAIEMAIATGA